MLSLKEGMIEMAKTYACTQCKSPTKRELLTVKKIIFQEIGVKPRQARSRTAAWLCPLCLSRDPDWNRPAYVAPGVVGAEEFSASTGQLQ